MINETLLRKRQQIERGELKTWSRRGRAHHARKWRFRNMVLRFSLRLLRLHARGVRNALSPIIRHLHLTFEDLPAAFDGFTILHLTDLHIDGLAALTDKLSESLRHVEVDLCVLTGDYRFGVSGPCDTVYANMARLLSGVKARYGIVGVLGNHDAAEMVPEFARMGVRILMNEALEVQHDSQNLWLLGLDDPHHYGCDDLPGALRDVPQDAFTILLVHTPELIEEAQQSGVNLYLCGHTHGGQVCLPFIKPLITHTRCPRKYTRGVWHYKSLQGFTNSGAGCSGVTVRFHCPPEIGLIALHRTELTTTRPCTTEMRHRVRS